jgi:hypothetical protein
LKFFENYKPKKEAVMNNKEITKEYFKLSTKIEREKQFNRKVELNGQIHRFKITHDLTININDPITTLFIKGVKVATICKQYSNKKVNLEYKELKKKLLVMS